MPKEDLHIKQATALVAKLEGNSLFSSGNIAGAASKYSEALSLCPMRFKKERVVLYSNRAQCHAERLVKKQMHAAWLFREAVVKHGGVHCEGDAGDMYGQEADDSEWETAGESDIGNDGRGDVGDEDSEWRDDEDRRINMRNLQ